MNVYATARTTTPMKADERTGKVYEGKPVTTRSARCSQHNRICSTFIGVNQAESDGKERWVFWCRGQDEVAAGNVVSRAVGHYFAARPPLDA